MADEKTMKRGRPPRNPVDRLRAKLWYWAVKSRQGWSDYRLDIEFVREEQEKKCSGEYRRRAFGRIGRHGIVPSSGNHHLRHYDLIARVDAHPDFAGTAAVFRSSFWDLLKADVMRLSEAHAFVSHCMTVSQVFRPSGKYEMALRMDDLWPSGTTCDRYEAALSKILMTKPPDLDTLALVGGLYREAYLACALQIAVLLRDVFLDLLNQFCGQDWPRAIGEDLLVFARDKVLYWQINVEFSKGSQPYDTRPADVVERPLLPIDEISWPAIEEQDSLYDRKMEDFKEFISGN